MTKGSPTVLFVWALSSTARMVFLGQNAGDISVSTVFFVYNGSPLLGEALGLTDVGAVSTNRFSDCNETRQKPWDHHTPDFMFITEYALASVIRFAILIMFGWHLWNIGQGETSVGAQDDDQHRRIARSRGRVSGSVFSDKDGVFTRPEGFVNSYDLG